MNRIFISYRRDDSADVTGRIYDHLIKRFGRENVFKDVDTIEHGADFRKSIAESVTDSSVFLAVIGDRWLDLADESGRRRLDDPNDFVRLEIEMALQLEIRVIPVLVRAASVPPATQLPQTIENLAYRHAISIRDDPDFTHDTSRLIESISGDHAIPRPESAPVDASAQTLRPKLLGPLFRWFRDRRALRRYLDRIVDEHQYFTFLGRAKPLDLDKLYIALKVGDYVPAHEKPHEPAVNSNQERLGMESVALQPPEALMLDPPRLLILGEPGSGKTTLLKYLALHLASRDPVFGEFARKHVPNAAANAIDRVQRSLATLNLTMPGFLLSLAGLLAWLVALFFSPHPVYGLCGLASELARWHGAGFQAMNECQLVTLSTATVSGAMTLPAALRIADVDRDAAIIVVAVAGDDGAARSLFSARTKRFAKIKAEVRGDVMDGYTPHDFVDVYPALFFLNHATRKGSKQKVGSVGYRAIHGKQINRKSDGS